MSATELYNLIFPVLIAGSALFAAAVGRGEERAGAFLVMAATVTSFGVQALFGKVPLTAFLAIDLLALTGIIVLFLRSKLLWIGIAAVSQTLVLAFDATRYLDFPLTVNQFLLATNTAWLGVTLSLAGGAWARRWGPQDEYALDAAR